MRIWADLVSSSLLDSCSCPLLARLHLPSYGYSRKYKTPTSIIRRPRNKTIHVTLLSTLYSSYCVSLKGTFACTHCSHNFSVLLSIAALTKNPHVPFCITPTFWNWNIMVIFKLLLSATLHTASAVSALYILFHTWGDSTVWSTKIGLLLRGITL